MAEPAREGEFEVFQLSPEVGKCYEHIEATRKEYIGDGKSRYFTTNTPRYVGKFIRQERYGSGDGQEVTDIFDNGSVEYSYGYTCFIEVPCREIEEKTEEIKTEEIKTEENKSWFQRVFGAKGGYRKRKTKRKNRKLKSKSKKSRK
jgi:hypothetical protein